MERRNELILIVEFHIAKHMSTPVIDELLARLNGDKYTIFEFEHLQALAEIMYTYAKQPTQTSW